MKKIKSIHFVGIKGVGMTPLAILAKEAGLCVSGCDIPDEFITDSVLKKANIIPFPNFSADHIKNIDLVITTGAHGGVKNEEVIAAKDRGIEVITQGEAVGLFMKGEIFQKAMEGISIAGSHGKTTTTALIATLFQESGLDPSYVIGTSEIASLPAPGHFGRGAFFIAEADEYAADPQNNPSPKFLWQNPKISLFTNIEFDHPDIYNSIEEVRLAFLSFAQKLPLYGVLIVNGDDRQIGKLCAFYKGRVVRFGSASHNDFILQHVRVSENQTFFWVETNKTSLGEFVINICGEHNAMNALGAIIVALEAGISLEKIKKSLLVFTGSKRRAEFVGRLKSGAFLFDDYAHHPTEIRKTLTMFNQRFANKKIVCIFQPHTYSRTKKLFDDFMSSFRNANTVILMNIYASLREKPDTSVSSQNMAEKMSKFSSHVVFLPTLSDVVEYLNSKNFGDDTVVITMGAGDVYKISSKLKVKSYG